MCQRFTIFEEKTDDELISLLTQNNEKAFVCIYERYHRLLYVVAFKYLKSKELSQDAVQQIFLRLWEGRSMLMIQVNLKNYLFTMLKNHVLNEIRNSLTALEKIYEMSQRMPQQEDSLDKKLEKQEAVVLLYQAIETLPDQKRQVCLYKLKEDLSNQEIADKMGLSVPTVKSHYSKAIQMLRDYFYQLFILLLMGL